MSAKGQTVWVSGDKGTVLKTTDGGMTWRAVAPRGVADVDFRDIEVIDDRTAFLMSSGRRSAIADLQDHRRRRELDAAHHQPRTEGFLGLHEFLGSDPRDYRRRSQLMVGSRS